MTMEAGTKHVCTNHNEVPGPASYKARPCDLPCTGVRCNSNEGQSHSPMCIIYL